MIALPQQVIALVVVLFGAGSMSIAAGPSHASENVAAHEWVHGGASTPSHLQWQSSLEAFSAEDRADPPELGGTVFVGSSSIRMWNDLESSFQSQPTLIKRGFGGSRLLDCALLAQQLVIRYKPRLVVLYAGENDLAEGASPSHVLDRFRRFVDTVRKDLPNSRIVFVSIKPSPAREALIPLIRETNAMIETYSRTAQALDYVDVFSPMLDSHGRPRAELFQDDWLHLNAAGYALWTSLLSARL